MPHALHTYGHTHTHLPQTLPCTPLTRARTNPIQSHTVMFILASLTLRHRHNSHTTYRSHTDVHSGLETHLTYTFTCLPQYSHTGIHTHSLHTTYIHAHTHQYAPTYILTHNLYIAHSHTPHIDKQTLTSLAHLHTLRCTNTLTHAAPRWNPPGRGHVHTHSPSRRNKVCAQSAGSPVPIQWLG